MRRNSAKILADGRAVNWLAANSDVWMVARQAWFAGEMPVYGGEGSREAVASWAQIMVADSARLCDFIGPHVYPVGDDRVRQHYAAAWACELATTFGRPVTLEEFGLSSDFASDENATHYYRQAMHNSPPAGATGWLGWCNSDYDDLIHQDPYRHHAFELHFGLTDSRGVPKPQLAEMKAFADILNAADIAQCDQGRLRDGPDRVCLSGHQLPVH